MPEPISWEFAWPYLLTALVVSYLLGSIPFGTLLTRFTGAGDLTKIGSGSIGATNVLRTGRKELAALTLVLDIAKGALAVLVAARWGADMAIFASVGVFFGHIYPVWLKFRGGKGVATYIGILIGLFWQVALIFVVAWLVVAAISRISSLSALTGAVVAPLAMAWYGELQFMETTIFFGGLIFLTHHTNIARLVRGQEPKISLSAPAAKNG
ncbi:MAG: glycerol-3-phosphate 1-O-acyltransferase PlsY [Alphaproteobacteria bacterium]